MDIAINNDLAVESNEYFTLFLNSTSENVNIDRSSSTVTISIEDDDSINGMNTQYIFERMNEIGGYSCTQFKLINGPQ